MTGITLDAGALIALERGDRRMALLVKRAREIEARLALPTGVLGQVWRDGARQAVLARLVADSETVELVPLDARAAKEAGQLCGVRRTHDVIDASVVLCAKARGHAVATSDASDLRRLDPDLALVEV